MFHEIVTKEVQSSKKKKKEIRPNNPASILIKSVTVSLAACQ